MLDPCTPIDGLSAVSAGLARAGSGPERPETLQDFFPAADPPRIELQVETMSSFSSRVFLNVWYAVLVVALVVQSNVRLQWSSRNFCGAADEVSVYHVEEWNSSACLSWEAYWVRSGYRREVPQDSLRETQAWVSQKRASREAAAPLASKGRSSVGYGSIVWPPPDAVPAGSSSNSCSHEAHGVCLFDEDPSARRLHNRAENKASALHRSVTLSSSEASAGGGDHSASITRVTINPSPRPTMPPLRRVYRLRWTAQALSGVLDHHLNRFLHVFVSLASPLATHAVASPSSSDGAWSAPPPFSGVSQRVYEVLVALEETSLTPDGDSSESSSSSSSSDSAPNASKQVYTYRTSVTCWRDWPRCSNIVLPSSVVIPSNNSQFTLTLIDLDAELAEASLDDIHVNRGFFSDLVAMPEPHPLSRAGTFWGTTDLNRQVQELYLQDSSAARGASARSSPSSGVGLMYQRFQYTVATVVFRYFFLLLTLLLMLRFLYQGRQALCMQYEQKWTLAAQIGLILYLNPLYLWCIYATRSTRAEGTSDSGGHARRQAQTVSLFPDVSDRFIPLCLYYVEFHIPTYFAALIVCYVWSIIAGSFRWHVSTNGAPLSLSDTGPHLPASARPEVNPHLCTNGFEVCGSRRSLAPPANFAVPSSRVARLRARVLLIFFFAVVMSLDLTKCYLEEESISAGRLTCTSSMCLLVDKCISYLLLCGLLSSGFGLYWLRRNLARHSYLSTRPQQLACRIMIFMYFTGCIYSIAQVVLLDALYAQLLDIIYYRPLVQFSHLLVLTSLVNHMTYVYTTTQSSLEIPLRPSDPRWKRVGWSKRWYRWLSSHGGSLYVFFSEAEERLFYEVQVAYQQAKQAKKLGKQKKKTTPISGDGAKAARAADWVGSPGKDDNVRFRCRCSAFRCKRGDREADVDGVQGCSHAETPAVSPADNPTFTSAAAAIVATAPFTAGREAVEDAKVDGTPLGEKRECLPSLNTPKWHDRVSVFSNHLATPSANAVGTMDTHGDVASVSFPEDLMPQQSGGSFGLEDKPSSRAAGCTSTDVVGVRGVSIGDIGTGRLSPSSQMGSNSGRASRCLSSRVLEAVHTAENRLMDGTATFLDFLAETCVDQPLRVILRQKARQSFVFFNLETAIDCLNMSHEAYAVEESRGDGYIRTGIQVTATEVPKAALGLAERVAMALFGLWFKPSPHDSRVDHEGREDDAATYPRPVSEDERAPLLHDHCAHPSTPEARDSTGTQVSSSPKRSTQAQLAVVDVLSHPSASRNSLGGCGRLPEDVPSSTRVAAPAADFIGGISCPPGASKARGSSLLSSPCNGVQSFPTSARARPADAGAGSWLFPPMNVEQYGYHRVAVLEARGVQVVVARMDTSGGCSMHSGKVPRLIVAFRGTDNVANAMEDIRFRQRAWKEMETPTLSARASVHSGFLELWMSLKTRVVDVVLAELRRHYVPTGGPSAVDSVVNMTCPRGGSATRAAAIPSPPMGDGPYPTSVSFSPTWVLPRGGGDDRGGVGTDGCASEHPLGSSEGFMRIYVTGHSLGGALASLCAYTLRRVLLLINYPEPDLVVYTFGQPRIGNSVFKQYYNRAIPCTFRVVNESDAVSGFNFFGGHHVGVQVNIDRYGNYVCKPMHIERMFLPTRGGGFALSNHTIAAYANSLNAMADVYSHGACPVRCCRPYVDEIESLSSTCGDEDDQSTAAASKSHATRSVRSGMSAAKIEAGDGVRDVLA